jgi:hypothetical protein
MEHGRHERQNRRFLAAVKTARDTKTPAALPSSSPLSQSDVSWSICFLSCADTFPKRVGVPKAYAPASRKSFRVTNGTPCCIALPALMSSRESITDCGMSSGIVRTTGSHNLFNAFSNMGSHAVDMAIGAVVDDEDLHACIPFPPPLFARVDLRGRLGMFTERHRQPTTLLMRVQFCDAARSRFG